MKRRQLLRQALGIVLMALAVIVSQAAIASSTLDEVKSRGKIIAGVRYDSPPFGSLDQSGQVVGFDIDLIKEISKRIGVGIEMVQVTAKTRIPLLESGKIDVIAAVLTHSRERERVIDFSISYLLDGQRLLVKKGSGIKEASDLKGKTVSAVQGSYNEATIRKLVPEAKILVFQEYPQAYLALKQGLADAFTTTATILEGMSKQDSDIEMVGEYLTSEPIGFGLRENDSKWRDAINFALQDMVADGTYKAIYDKYFKIPYRAPETWAP